VRAGKAIAGPVQTVLTQQHLEHVYGVSVDVSRNAAGTVTVQVISSAGGQL
jgi:hypothetical protein